MIALVLTVPIMIVLSLIPQLNTPQHQQTVGALFLFLMYGASFASQAFTKPVSGIAMMLFYYDQRIRKEAFDIEWMMREAGMEAGTTAPADAVAAAVVAPWTPAGDGALPLGPNGQHFGNAQEDARGESS